MCPSEQADPSNKQDSSIPTASVMKQTSRTAEEIDDPSRTASDPKNPFPFPTADHHDAPPRIEQPVLQDTSEDALDAGVEESFPASDPVSVTVTKVVPVVPAKPAS